MKQPDSLVVVRQRLNVVRENLDIAHERGDCV